MSEPHLLHRESPELAELIDNLPADDRGRTVRRVVEHVAEMTGVAADCRTSTDLKRLVQQLDEEAWDLQDRDDASGYERAFGRARAANAWMETASGDSRGSCYDAIYEARHAAMTIGVDIAALFGS